MIKKKKNHLLFFSKARQIWRDWWNCYGKSWLTVAFGKRDPGDEFTLQKRQRQHHMRRPWMGTMPKYNYKYTLFQALLGTNSLFDIYKSITIDLSSTLFKENRILIYNEKLKSAVSYPTFNFSFFNLLIKV